MICGMSWIDQHIAPIVPRTFAAIGMFIASDVGVGDEERRKKEKKVSSEQDRDSDIFVIETRDS